MIGQGNQLETESKQKVKIAIQYRKGFPWLLLSPTLVVLAFLGIFPFIYAMRIAAFNISISKPYLPQIFLGHHVIRIVMFDGTAAVDGVECVHALISSISIRISISGPSSGGL